MGIFGKLRGIDKKTVEKKPKQTKTLEQLITELGSQDEETRAFAAGELGKLHDKRAVDPLIERLKDESWKVREEAAWSLGNMGDEKVAESLIAFLVESLTIGKLEIRRSATEVVGSIVKYRLSGQNQEYAINLMIKTLSREDSNFCGRIEFTLWKIGNPAIAPLVKSLKSEDWRVRMNAAVALGHINYQRIKDPPRILLDPSAIFCLETKINDTNDRRNVAIAVEPLIEALEDNEPLVRQYTAYALGRIEDKRGIRQLEVALNDSNLAVSKEAEEALQRIRKNNPEVWALELGEKKDYRTLAAIFNSTDWNDKLRYSKEKHAKDVLRKAGLEAVDAILEETAKDGVGKDDLAELLVNINDTKAVPVLKKMLDRGCFDAYGVKFDVEKFVMRHPELQGEVETLKCALCGKQRLITEMRGSGDKYFCLNKCWDKRGRIIGSTFYGAKKCPYYSEGTCMGGSGEIGTCSLGFGSYDTTCYVYKIAKTRRF
jgi:HEAT repeat protein